MIQFSQTQSSKASWEHHFLIDLNKPCRSVSSAVLGGGFQTVRYVINRSVVKNWQSPDPEQDMRSYVKHLKIEPEHCIGLITAVPIKKMQALELERDDWLLRCFVTAGVSNAARAGGKNPLPTRTGTINIILIIFGKLSDSALIDAVQTATEAKAAALQDANIQTRFAEQATGTTTDAIAIINYLNEPKTNYAGLATTPGYLIGQAVYEASFQALRKG